MAIAFFQVNYISRQKGNSIVASAAYRSCEKLFDERNEKDHDYTRKKGRISGDLILPDGLNFSKQELWNYVETIEKRNDARLAKEYVVALPKELSNEENTLLAKDIAKLLSQEKKDYGTDEYIVQWDVHAPHISAALDENGDFIFDENGKKVIEDNSNIHCHFLVTERAWNKESGCFNTKKDRDRNSKEWLANKKLEVGELINSRLREKNIPCVDFRSWKERNEENIEKTGQELERPQKHIGVKKNNMLRKSKYRKARIRQQITKYEKAIKELDLKKEGSSGKNQNKVGLNIKQDWISEIDKKSKQNILHKNNSKSTKNIDMAINSKPVEIKSNTNKVLPKINGSAHGTSDAQKVNGGPEIRCAMCGVVVMAKCKKCHFYYEDLENGVEQSNENSSGHSR